MSQLEANQDPAGEQAERSQEDNQNDPGHQSDHGQRRGQGEHAIAHDLGDHEDGHELPRERLVLDLAISMSQ